MPLKVYGFIWNIFPLEAVVAFFAPTACLLYSFAATFVDD
jgi:hypothetical protein